MGPLPENDIDKFFNGLEVHIVQQAQAAHQESISELQKFSNDKNIDGVLSAQNLGKQANDWEEFLCTTFLKGQRDALISKFEELGIPLPNRQIEESIDRPSSKDFERPFPFDGRPIEGTLNLPERLCNWFLRYNFHCLGSLNRMTSSDLLGHKDFGPKSLLELNTELAAKGVTRKESETDVETEENTTLRVNMMIHRLGQRQNFYVRPISQMERYLGAYVHNVEITNRLAELGIDTVADFLSKLPGDIGELDAQRVCRQLYWRGIDPIPKVIKA